MGIASGVECCFEEAEGLYVLLISQDHECRVVVAVLQSSSCSCSSPLSSWRTRVGFEERGRVESSSCSGVTICTTDQ